MIARGAKTHVDVLIVAAAFGGMTGIGEGTPIYYRGESAGSCLAQIEAITGALEDASPGEARLALQEMLAPGAARNALDAALWELEAKQAGKPLWQYLDLAEPQPLQTAYTISLGDGATMAADAAAAAEQGYGLLKLKLTGEGIRERAAAVHRAAPGARLIVDANGSWGDLDIAEEAAALSKLGAEMIEQPLPEGDDRALADIRSPLPILADESCHDAGDVARLAQLYDGVNIKLDKAGGMTEAMKMAELARAHDMRVMVGCMLSTSTGIAPAFLLAQQADWVDLDGPALLAKDREDGFVFNAGLISQ